MPDIQSDDIKHSYYSTAIKNLISWQSPEKDLMQRKNPNFAENPVSGLLKNKEVIVANQFVALIKAEGVDALKRNFNEQPLTDAPELNALLQDKGRYTLFHAESRKVLKALATRLVRELNPPEEQTKTPSSSLTQKSAAPYLETPDIQSKKPIDQIINTFDGGPILIQKGCATRLDDREAFATFKAADGTVGIDRLIYKKIAGAGITDADTIDKLANTLASQLLQAYFNHPLIQTREVRSPERANINGAAVVFQRPADLSDPVYEILSKHNSFSEVMPSDKIYLYEGGLNTRSIYNNVLKNAVADFDFKKAITSITTSKTAESTPASAPKEPTLASRISGPITAEALIQWAFQQEHAEWIAGILKAEQAPLRTNNAPRQNYANATINSVFTDYKKKLERNPEALQKVAEAYAVIDHSDPSPVITAAEKLGVVNPALPLCLTSNNR